MSTIDWDARYRDGETPWEKGMAHPALPFFVSTHPGLFSGKPHLFQPGCGFGHDAAFLAPFCEKTTALDISAKPIAKALTLYPEKEITWKIGDLFTQKGEKYDLIWEHTCFCAIPPATRPDYVRTIADLLKHGGHLTGIFFLDPDHLPEEGPPFGVTRDELKDLFSDKFSLIKDIPNPPTYHGREGRETLMIWQKRT